MKLSNELALKINRMELIKMITKAEAKKLKTS